VLKNSPPFPNLRCFHSKPPPPFSQLFFSPFSAARFASFSFTIRNPLRTVPGPLPALHEMMAIPEFPPLLLKTSPFFFSLSAIVSVIEKGTPRGQVQGFHRCPRAHFFGECHVPNPSPLYCFPIETLRRVRSSFQAPEASYTVFPMSFFPPLFLSLSSRSLPLIIKRFFFLNAVTSLV